MFLPSSMIFDVFEAGSYGFSPIHLELLHGFLTHRACPPLFDHKIILSLLSSGFVQVSQTLVS